MPYSGIYFLGVFSKHFKIRNCNWVAIASGVHISIRGISHRFPPVKWSVLKTGGMVINNVSVSSALHVQGIGL
jgi:hypothetical protein